MTEIYRKDFAGPGSSYTRGVGTFRDTQAVRTGHYYTSDMSDIGLKAAVDAVVGIDGTTHPNNSSLQLQRATAIRLDAHLVRIQMQYGYRSSSTPTASASDLTQSESGYVTFTSWRKPTSFDGNGRPDGNFNFESASDSTNRRKPPRPITYQLPTQVVTVPTIRSTRVGSSVLAKLGTCNSDIVTFRGEAYAARSIRLESIVETPVEVSGGVKFLVRYVFVFRRSLWVVELEPKFVGGVWANDPDATISPRYALACEESVFTGAFPTDYS